MLAQLIINDLAIISKLSLDFESGMTVLTGETGAGKSILLDALGLILGDRADTNIIRGNSEKTDITAIFFIKNNAAVIEKLKNIEIESNNDELFIRRSLRTKPKSIRKTTGIIMIKTISLGSRRNCKNSLRKMAMTWFIGLLLLGQCDEDVFNSRFC